MRRNARWLLRPTRAAQQGRHFRLRKHPARTRQRRDGADSVEKVP
jgi:hypothetical protein